MTDRGFDLLDHALGRPLGYPGTPPRTSGLLVDDVFHEVPAAPDGRVLDHMVREAGVATLDRRSAVLAIGSNASPAQLRAKFTTHRVSAVVPMTVVTVAGLGRAHSAHVSAAGYVPMTPIRVAGSRSQAFVLWVDAAQLDALDRTEPNYERRALAGALEVTLESNERLHDVALYVSRWGHLLAADGSPLQPDRPPSQTRLIEGLLSRSGELRDLAGPTPADFVSRAAASRELRDEIRRCFARSGWVSKGSDRSTDVGR
ncbi:MAG: hypothetical protein JO291_05770 [Acidimicrobiia bacterium]|nr:hypothetical protein [Acidimicrobiia bacterium]